MRGRRDEAGDWTKEGEDPIPLLSGKLDFFPCLSNRLTLGTVYKHLALVSVNCSLAQGRELSLCIMAINSLSGLRTQ